MALGGAFCILCSGPPPLTSQRICESCFRERTELSILPDRIQQTRCPKCGLDMVGSRWSHMDRDDLHHARVQEVLDVHEKASSISTGLLAEPIDERATRLNVQVSGSIEGFVFEAEHEAILQTSDGVCPTCTRRAGHYYEATMQLRSAGRRLEEDEVTALRATLDDLLARIEPNPMFFITEEGAVTGGWDLQLGSKALAKQWARHLIDRYGGQAKESSTVIGHRDGEEVSRLTVLYRKPAYSLGDVLRYSGALWRVDAWRKEGPMLLSLDRRERRSTTWRDLEKSVVLSRTAEHVETEVLRRDDSAIDVLDPRDWQVRTIPQPYDMQADASIIRIALIEDEWVALPRTRAERGDGDE